MLGCDKRVEVKQIKIIKKSKWLERRFIGGIYFSYMFREEFSNNVRKGCFVFWEKGNLVRQKNVSKGFKIRMRL